MTQPTFDDVTIPRNTLAVWSLVLGISGLVLSVVVVGGFIGLAAVILGFIALVRHERTWMSLTAIVLGAVSLVAAFIAAFFCLFYLPTLQYRASSQRTWTIAEISNVKTALEAFQTDIGRYPTTSEGLQALDTHPTAIGPAWRGPYLESLPADKWGHPLVYRCPGTIDPTSYDLLSVGPDGIEGTTDDVGKNTK